MAIKPIRVTLALSAILAFSGCCSLPFLQTAKQREQCYTKSMCDYTPLVGQSEGFHASLAANVQKLNDLKVTMDAGTYTTLSQTLTGYDAMWEMYYRQYTGACESWALCQYRTTGANACPEQEAIKNSWYDHLKELQAMFSDAALLEKLKQQVEADQASRKAAAALLKTKEAAVLSGIDDLKTKAATCPAPTAGQSIPERLSAIAQSFKDQAEKHIAAVLAGDWVAEVGLLDATVKSLTETHDIEATVKGCGHPGRANTTSFSGGSVAGGKGGHQGLKVTTSAITTESQPAAENPPLASLYPGSMPSDASILQDHKDKIWGTAAH